MITRHHMPDVTFTLPETPAMKAAKMWPPHVGERKVLTSVPGMLFGCELWSDYPAVSLLDPNTTDTRKYKRTDEEVTLFLRKQGEFVAIVVASCFVCDEWPEWLFVGELDDLIPRARAAINNTLKECYPRGVVNPNAYHLTVIGGMRPDDPPGAQL